MIWNSLRGHHTQIDLFRRAIQRHRLAHAFLFCGPAGIGKRQFARRLAQCLFCTEIPDAELDACGKCSACRQLQADSHPDFIFVNCPEDKNIFPIELIIGPRENRGREGLCYELSLRPISGQRKIVVLDDADLMNAESANAFLKTLEEPPSYATIILLAASRESLLPTIQSRCQVIRFSALEEHEMAELLLQQQRVDHKDAAQELAAQSQGSFAIAEQLADPALRNLRNVIHTNLARQNFSGTSLSEETLAVLESLGDTNRQRRGFAWIAQYCIEFYQQQFRSLPTNGSAISANDHEYNLLELTGQLIERSATAVRQVERMAPVSLCVHSLFDDLSRIGRQRFVKNG